MRRLRSSRPRAHPSLRAEALSASSWWALGWHSCTFAAPSRAAARLALRSCFLFRRSVAISSIVLTTAGTRTPKRFSYSVAMKSGSGCFHGSCGWLSSFPSFCGLKPSSRAIWIWACESRNRLRASIHGRRSFGIGLCAIKLIQLPRHAWCLLPRTCQYHAAGSRRTLHDPVQAPRAAPAIGSSESGFPRQHFLNFLPLPQGHGSLRPTFRHA